MFTLPATKRVSSCVFAAAAKSTMEASPLTPCKRWSPCASAVSTLSEYCLLFMSACTWASLAPVSAKMAWSLLMRSPWGGVIDGRVGDGHRRHRHRVGDEYGHGRLNAEPPGEGHPRHIAELLGQD